MSALPPSIEAIWVKWNDTIPRPKIAELHQRIAAEACRLQREADQRDPTRFIGTPLVVEPPK